MAEDSQKNNLTRRKEEVGAVFWELRDVDSNLLRNELWVPRDVWQGGSVAALVLRSHWKDCDIACFWNEGFIQLWKRILGREPRRHTSLRPCVRLSRYRGECGSAFLMSLVLAQSASYRGSCSQKLHLPQAQHRGRLSLQEGHWSSHENPVFEILQVCTSHFSFVQSSVEPSGVGSTFSF